MTEEENKTTAPEQTTDDTAVQEEKKEVQKTSDTNTEQKTEKREQRSRRRQDRGRKREPKEFEEAILQIDRVTRVVAGGRRLRFRVSVVIGDQKGRVGFGIGKANEVMLGIQKAVSSAKKGLIQVPIFNGTLPHEIKSNFKSSKVLLFPAPEGKGVIAGGAVRKILELAGVRDVLSKVHGSRNRVNVAHATFLALEKLHHEAPHGQKKEVSESEEKKEKTPSKKETSAPKKQEKKTTSKKTKK
ncbi:30S ribosomal protein S5 [Candidatus Gracilibacteria bacterium]|nr:30S ribosomal protein S5 [Candidatus Gracilibacteria bacterium]MCF7819106.1 30S ribosomal protein S5 [Candidatus Gracilibacteria bacterium]